jgi:hypothetical protein
MFMRVVLASVPTTVLALAAGCSAVDSTTEDVPSVQNGRIEPQAHGVELSPTMHGQHWAKDAARPRQPANPNMTFHGGKIMTTYVSKAIFWGPRWADATFVGDKISGLDTFHAGYANSNYAATSNEYTGTNGQVGSTGTHLGSVIDTTTATGGNNPSAILAEVCRTIVPDPSGNGYYPVYTDVRRGRTGYCAWHSAGTCGGTLVQFAFFFDLDGDPGCDPQDARNVHSQGLAALANVSAHELSEARTDPASPGAWYDSSGNENGDKCAWSFGAPFVTFSNGSEWKLQGEWSNAAYTAGDAGTEAGIAYPNLGGQYGCLAGN